MKKLLFFLGICTSLIVQSQNLPDSVVMTVAGKQIPLDEYLFMAEKNGTVNFSDDASLKEYVELYKNFKLKVADAEALGLDQTKEFRDDVNQYTAQLTESYLTDKKGEEEYTRYIYDRGNNKLEVSHVIFRMPRKALNGDTLVPYNEAKQLYDRIMAGEDIDVVGKNLTAERGKSEVDYERFWHVTPLTTQKAFENTIYNMQVGEVSLPIRTDFGYHVIKLQNKTPIEEPRPSFESQRREIAGKLARSDYNFEFYATSDEKLKKSNDYKFYPEAYAQLNALCETYFPDSKEYIENAKNMQETLFEINGYKFTQAHFVSFLQRSPLSARYFGGDFLKEVYGVFIRELLRTAEKTELPVRHPEYNFLLQEYRDGSLLFEISNQKVWTKPANEQKKLEEEWINELVAKYPVEINWEVLKKIQSKL